ncbi:hypothetical protein BU25DRAFT_129932 [Macroventuria anomochaeta]|uniref:Uncharacterized protein n=1 Tax=Macroventuria anomochaeta TaxID=301207 RepID=A0ACB6RVR1_9PLEO|nr:uncharacterized protein BU25DRAFT_129932 [Macroventuria anomochaeta]KAF2624982.1 hypothetical protein BU25DRAFT_129932 [Macroventuria anomochaeta]
MKFTLLFGLTTLIATAWASSPNPSNTNIKINTSPRTTISKSRTSPQHLAREPSVVDSKAHTALHYLSNAIRDASTDAVKARSGMRGMSRRTRTKRESGAEGKKAQHRSTDLPMQQRGTGESQQLRRSGMGKARSQRTPATQRQQRQQRGEPKFLPRVSRS